MTLDADPVTAIRTRLARLDACVGAVAALPDGPEHLATLRGLLSGPTLQAIIAQAEQSQVEAGLRAGRLYLEAYRAEVAAQGLEDVLTPVLRLPTETDGVCRLVVEDCGMPPDSTDRASVRERVRWQIAVEDRVHERVLAADTTAHGAIIFDHTRPAAAGAAALDSLPDATLQAIAASGGPGTSVVANALLAERHPERSVCLTGEQRRQALFGDPPPDASQS